MPKLETYQKRVKQIVRWHRARDHSVGDKVRLLARLRDRSDAEILDAPLPLALAQEVVAVEAGFETWAALKAGAGDADASQGEEAPVALGPAIPVLLVRDVAAAGAFYAGLGFAIDFLHGKPPFYGSVSCDAARLHLRFVHVAAFAEIAAREPSLIAAMIEVIGVKRPHADFAARGAAFPQGLVQHPWGGLDFQLRDPDGNCIAFVEHRAR
jgi:hypothetical protein